MVVRFLIQIQIRFECKCKRSLKIPVIRIRKTKNRKQYRKGTKANNDLQNTIQKTKDRATRTILKTGVNSGAPEG